MLSALIQHFSAGNKAQFAKLLGVTPQTVSTWLARNTFDADKVFACCEGVNGDWLLSGAGPMLKEAPSAYDATVSGNSNGGSNITNSPNSPVNVNDSDTIRQLLTMLEAKDEQINTLLTIIQNGKAG